jgi:hypothetical protein
MNEFCKISRLVIVFTAACLVFIRCNIKPAQDPLKFIPAENEGFIAVKNPGEFAKKINQTLSNLKTASGILQAVEIYSGLDLRSPESLSENGFDPARGAVLLIDKGVVFIVCGFQNQRKLESTVSERLRRFGFRNDKTKESYLRPGSIEKASYRFENGIMFLAYSMDGADTGSAIETLINLPLEKRSADPHFSENSSDISGCINLKKVLKHNHFIGMLGKSALPLSFISGFYENVLPSLALSEKEILSSVVFTTGQSSSKEFSSIKHSDNAVFLLNMNFPVASVNKMPVLLRSMILNNTLFAGIHPVLGLTGSENILNSLTGKINLGIMGLSKNPDLADLGKKLFDLQGFLSLFDSFVSIQLKDAEKIFENIEELNNRLAPSGYRIEKNFPDQSQAVFFIKDRSEKGIRFILSDSWLINVSENISSEDLPALLKSRKKMFTDTGDSLLSISFVPDRIVKQLGRRGFFPYFLSIINDIETINIKFDVSEKEISLKSTVKFR